MKLKGAARVARTIATAGMLAAALCLALPLDALACTQIYVGSDYTDTGDTYVGRSEDYAERYAKFFGVQESMENPTYVSDESTFSWTYEGTSYRYTYVRDAADAWDEDRPYSEAGTNEMGVSVSATESTSMNSSIRQVDPLSDSGIGEFNIPDVILGTSATARDGVERLGSLVDEYGSSECNQIIIADSSETWLFMQLSGYQWIAILMPDDVVSVNPNMGNLQFETDLDNDSICLHSEGIVEVAKEAGTYTEFEDGTMNVAASYGETSTGSVRYVQGHLYFGDELVEGTDYTVSGNSIASIASPQLMFTPGSSSTPVTLNAALRAFAARGEQSTSSAVNADLGASGAIGSQRTTEAHLFQIRSGLSSDIATIEWIALSPAEFNVYLPVYGALLTEVDETYFPANDAYTTDWGIVADGALDGTEETYIDRIFMDINTLASDNRETMAEGVRDYLDAVQESIIDQQDVVDELMQATSAGSARNELANKAFAAASEELCSKASTLLDEMRAYVEEGDTSSDFVPSDYDEATGSMKAPFTYADAVTGPTISSQPASAKYTQGATAKALSITANAYDDDDSLTYQWYVADGSVEVDDNLTGFTKVDGATSATYTPSTDTVGEKTYVVVVTNAEGLSTTSERAVVSVVAATDEGDGEDEGATEQTGTGESGDAGEDDGTAAGTDDGSATGAAEDSEPDASASASDTMPATDDASFEAIALVAILGVVCVGAGVVVRRRHMRG